MDAQRRGVCKRSRHPRQFTSSSSISTSSFSFPACTRGEVESSHARANCHVPFVYIILFPPLANQTVRLSLSIYLSRVRTQPSFPISSVREREAPSKSWLRKKPRSVFTFGELSSLHANASYTYTHSHTNHPSYSPPAFSLSLSRSLTQSLERSEPPT